MRSPLVFAVLSVLAVGCANVPATPEPFTGAGRAAVEEDEGDEGGEGDDDDRDRGKDDARGSSRDDDDGYEPQTPRTDTKARKFWARDHVQEWFGEAASTSRVPFGGGKWCNYQVMLSDLRLRVTFDEEGRVIASSFANLMNETAASCEALGQQSNTFAMPPASPRAELSISLAPAPENLPQANVKVTLEPVDANHVTARVFVQRTGGAEPALDWKLDTTLELTPL